MEDIRIGYDDNLGLPTGFANLVPCATQAYHDLTQLLHDFNTKQLSAMFIPAGTLPYIKSGNVISQSLFGPDKKLTLRSNFISTDLIKLTDIAGLTLGCVNQYCTTSFWAPMIYLSRVLPEGSTISFKYTNGFYDLLEKTANQKIKAAMLWDIILAQNPTLTNKVHQFFDLDQLPTPVIVAQENFPQNLIKQINQLNIQDAQGFFTGFQIPQWEIINPFLNDIKFCKQFFGQVQPVS